MPPSLQTIVNSATTLAILCPLYKTLLIWPLAVSYRWVTLCCSSWWCCWVSPLFASSFCRSYFNSLSRFSLNMNKNNQHNNINEVTSLSVAVAAYKMTKIFLWKLTLLFSKLESKHRQVYQTVKLSTKNLQCFLNIILNHTMANASPRKKYAKYM